MIIQKQSLQNSLLLIFSIVFFNFLIIGISLGILPDFIHDKLKFGNFLVGMVIGIQYLSTLMTRHLAGQCSDKKGGQYASKIGLILSLLACIMNLMGINLINYPLISLICICLGRVILGVGESYLIIGLFAWGFSIVGPEKTGKVMVWNGLGMHAGMACGAPLGIYIQNKLGIQCSYIFAILLPCFGYIVSNFLPTVSHPRMEKRLPFYSAVRLVWPSGLGLALASVGFSAIVSFITLYFLQNSWKNASIAMTSFGAGYIITRLFFSDAPDKYGGVKVVLICLIIEITGQFLLWQASSSITAIIGSLLTGCGMSLVFPSFGKIAIENIPISNRGMAMAAYNAFFDLGMGLTGPIAGIIAGGNNYHYIYLFGLTCSILSVFLVLKDIFIKKKDNRC